MDLLEVIRVLVLMPFILRDEQGDIMYDQGDKIEDTSNMEVGEYDILQASRHYSHT